MNPEKFDRYEIISELGRGGMATVYRANDPRFEREVAIKVLPREMLHDPQFRARFEREAKTIAMLEHPAIVPVYDFGEQDGQPYLVMRFMNGGSLADRLEKGPLTVQEASRLFATLAPALDTAHAKGIIHRDLKPGNILYDQYGEPYISDFGIAKLSESQASVSMTGSAIVGTPAYMSPEQAQGEKVDGRSDIYAMGVILYEALTGQQPFYGDTPMSVLVKHITDPIPHILDIKPDLPAGVEKIIEKALAKDRGERFATCQKLSEALSAVARGEVPDLGPAPTATRMAMPRTEVGRQAAAGVKPAQPKVEVAAVAEAPRKRTWLYAGLGLAGLVLCIGLVGGGLLLFKDQIPFLTQPTETVPIVQSSPTHTFEQPTRTEGGGILPVVPTDTPTEMPATLTNTPTPQGLEIGGADMIALVNANDIWVMRVDGSDLRQLTTDGAAKHSLQWSPDGQSVFYISGKCLWMVSLEGVADDLGCFVSSDFFEDIAISPDGTQIAIALDRVVYVVPFDIEALRAARNHDSLTSMSGCFTYDDALSKGVAWSSDSQKIVIKIWVPEGGIRVEQLRVIDISSCNSANPYILDTFPASRFTMSGYGSNPVIPSYSWNGEVLFLLNSIARNNFYGYLYLYNMSTYTAKLVEPMNPSCCFSNAQWSPDGTYIFYVYQNINQGDRSRNELYYIQYGTIGSGTQYAPLPVPDDFLTNTLELPGAVLRRVK